MSRKSSLATHAADRPAFDAAVMGAVALIGDSDGFEAASLLKTFHKTRDIPIIAISAAAMNEDIERSKIAGFASRFEHTT